MQLGGYVLSSRDDNTSPPMGSGHFDNGVYQRTCFMSQVELVDHNFDLVDSPTGVQTAMSRCYLLTLKETSHTKTTAKQVIAFVLAEPVSV